MTEAEWSLGGYARLCRAFKDAGYRICTMDDYLRDDPTPHAAILRHDVDRFPADALAMARLESVLGIRATYYIRMVPRVFSAALVSELHRLGHEVGYHYEVLHKTRGDTAAALELFARELEELRRLGPVTTATAHGSPLSRWDSLDLWHHARPMDFGLRGEPYLVLDPTRVAYYTDTGRSWCAGATNLRDRPGGQAADFPTARNTAALEEIIASRTVSALCLQTHPERWHDPGLGHLRSLALDVVANTVKRFLVHRRRGGRARD